MKKYIQILIFTLCNCTLFCQVQIGADILGVNLNDDFGSGVAINEDGNIVAIGAHRRNSGRGIVEVYELKNGNWKLLGSKINGPNDNKWFGTDVALTPSGKRIIIGAYKENITRIYDYIDDDWLLTGEISFGMASWSIHFGYAVDISNDGQTVAISATHHPLSNIHRGIVNIYREINNQWLQIGDGIEGDFEKDVSGWDIALSDNGNTIAIGSISNDNYGEDAGQVRIFTFANNTWSQIGKSLHGDHEHLGFGFSLDMSENGKHLIVGAPLNWTGIKTELHYAEVYELINGDWSPKGNKIYGLDRENVGYDVAISDDGDRIAISVTRDKTCPIQIYDFIDSDWELVGSISHETEFHSLGYSIAMNPSGDVLIGTSRNPEGFAVVYDLKELNEPNCIRVDEPEEIIDSLNIYFPNAIRPYSTNVVNSVFFGQANEDIVYSISIFDRWGNLIFNNQKALANSMEDGWNPTHEFPQGVYVYFVKYFDNEKEEILIGNVTLIK